MNFSWIPFYQELADKLLSYKDQQKAILGFLYGAEMSRFTKYLHDADKKPLQEIDPFTTFGVFNRGVSTANRRAILQQFQQFFKIQAAVPQQFEGIPLLNNLQSYFFGYPSDHRRKTDDIDHLWDLFEAVVKDSDGIKNCYDQVSKQFCINNNLTLGLFWIRPGSFLPFDSVTRSYLKNHGVKTKGNLPDYSEYMQIIELARTLEPDFAQLSFQARQEAKAATEMINEEPADREDSVDEIVDLLRFSKNIIIQGAPGTGKTYKIPEYVVRLCDPDQPYSTRKAVVERYNALLTAKRVEFVTFHQSFDYEEFVEGIRSEVDENTVRYEVKDGIFKQLCERARRPMVKEDADFGIRENAVIWKVSLMGTYDNEVRSECLENSHIRIGWDDYGKTLTEDTQYSEGGRTVLDAFINRMQIGDIVFSCYSNRMIDAIGVVTGDYEWDTSFGDGYSRVRKVKWLVKQIKEDIYEINGQTTMTLSTVYRLNRITLEAVYELLKKYNVLNATATTENTEPYVLVIDEINRGNIAKIFGELITLIEPDKRSSGTSPAKATLPYSGDLFSVPSNLYIIGTMNTADRSIGGIDYALRRRFATVHVAPQRLH